MRREKHTGKGEKNNEGQKTKDAGAKKDGGGSTVVLKVDIHCEGCAEKVKRSVRSFEGVETVKVDYNTNKVTVVGNVDPIKLREKIEEKTKKKVELISPSPKKDKNGGGGGGEEKKNNDDKKAVKKSDDNKKSKEPAVTTVVLKTRLHCEGCIQKICRMISKTKGVEEVSVDRQKDLVTVKGTMDVKALTECLSEKFKRPVEVVPPKKEGGGGEKKEKEGGGGGGGDGAKKEEVSKVEGNKLDYTGMEYGYGYGPGHGYLYGPAYAVEPLHAPQMFSDENPNACSVM